MQNVGEGRRIEIFNGLYLCRIEVPSRWTGRSMKQLDFRRRYNLQALMVYRTAGLEKGDAPPGLFPDPDLKLIPGDKLLVLGDKEAIRKLQ